MKSKFITVLLVLVGLSLLLIAVWETQFKEGSRLVAFERNPEGIMGTSCRLIVVMDYRQKELAQKVLDKAEYQLRYIESFASNWIEHSEVSQLNRAGIGEFPLSTINFEILELAKLAFDSTDGAFDVTCRPQIELWKQAGKQNRLPQNNAIEAAKKQSSWNHLELNHENQSIYKKTETVRVDLGGIAKGYGIDAALNAIREQPKVAGALVDVGGDVRCWGTSGGNEGSNSWDIEIKDPFQSGTMQAFELQSGYSVCTSGNYARFVEIDGQKYSHILNPTTGLPAQSIPSVTVIAENAQLADVWATALSILGEQGIRNLPDGVEASLVIKDLKQDARELFQVSSSGFPKK